MTTTNGRPSRRPTGQIQTETVTLRQRRRYRPAQQSISPAAPEKKRIREFLASTLGTSLASKILGTSTVTFILGGAAWQWQTGYDEGIASRRGIALEFVQGSTTMGATPFEIVLLVLAASFILASLGMLVPAFTSWHIPGALGIIELLRGLLAVFHPHATQRWLHFLIGGCLILFAIIVEIAARILGRLRRRWLGRSTKPAHRTAKFAARFDKYFEFRIPARVDVFVTLMQVSLVLAVVAAAPLMAAAYFGRWVGTNAALPDQAVVIDGTTYLWLGTTTDGLIVARQADFCGASSPETATSVSLSGRRSTLLTAEGVTVVRLGAHIRVLHRCR